MPVPSWKLANKNPITIKPQNEAEVAEGLAYHDGSRGESLAFRRHSIPSPLFRARLFYRTFGMYDQPQLKSLKNKWFPSGFWEQAEVFKDVNMKLVNCS